MVCYKVLWYKFVFINNLCMNENFFYKEKIKNKKISHQCTAIASLPSTMHQLMELCKTKSDEPEG